MIKNKILIGVVFLIFVALGIQFSSAQYTSFTGTSNSFSSSNYQYQPSFQTYYGSNVGTYWPILSSPDQCTGRQDLILQVAPGGCTPAVVRSDLMADQNVPVFCQIDALQANPLINIKQISNIRFTGKYPNLVAGVGFHPANAALNTKDVLMGSPLLNNIGYVVVVLKQTPNETSLPGSVSLNLTGQVEYNSGNAYGIGSNEFALTPMTDSQWEANKAANTFWQGRYFVRLDDANSNNAIVSIYQGDQKVSSTQVQVGQTSTPIYLPGAYCQAGLQVQYVDYERPQNKARIEITTGSGTDSLDVYEGSSFLNNQCNVRKINLDASGTTGNIVINCGFSNAITLYLKPLYNYKIIPQNVIPTLDNGNLQCSYKDVNGNVYTITRTDVNTDWNTFSAKSKDNNDLTGDNSQVQTELKLRCNAQIGKGLSFVDDILPTNSNGQNAETIFNQSIGSYEAVANDYPSEKQDAATGDYYGKVSLQAALSLAQLAQSNGYLKQQTISNILSLLIKLYPDQGDYYKNQLNQLYQVDSSSSVAVINANNQLNSIRLVSLSQPEQLATATVTIDFGTQTSNPILGNSIPVPGLKNVQAKLVYFDGARAIVETNCVVIDSNSIANSNINTNPNPSARTITNTAISNHTFIMGQSYNVCGLPFIYRDTNLQSVARIRLLPYSSGTGTETNLTVHIGIEKRNIKLSPEKAQEMANNINDSIKKWEGISANLVKLETGLKAACFATSAVLTVKTFISGIDGTSTARQQAMEGDHGWTKRCNDALGKSQIDRYNTGDPTKFVTLSSPYTSLTQCFNGEEQYINSDISSRTTTLNQVNNQLKTIESSTSTNGVVNQDAATAKLYTQIQSDCPTIKLPAPQQKPDNSGLYYPLTYQQLRDVYYNCILLNNNDPSAGQSAQKSIDDSVKEATANIGFFSKGVQSANSKGIIPIDSNAIGTSQILSGRFSNIDVNGDTINGVQANINPSLDREGAVNIPDGATKAVRVDRPRLDCGTGNPPQAGPFLVVGSESASGTLVPMAVYRYVETNDANGKTQSINLMGIPVNCGGNQAAASQALLVMKGYSSIQEIGQGLAGNNIRQQDQKVLYFTSGSDKDRPALVPFDVTNGWYAKVETSSVSLGSNSISAYDASGLPKRWQICNVGTDGAIDSRDQCQEVVSGISNNQPILGLDSKTSSDLVQKSQKALLDAGSQKPNGNGYVRIGNQNLPVGTVNPLDSVQCQQFMSITDCKILFNVCDPVICPASRCDLGGAYKVSNVQQTGIVGSALLCLPNAKEGVILPVCISGIRNGIDSYVALLKAHRDCLENSVKTGQLVGVCDEIYSIYSCEFFWREIGPLANILLPKLVETAYGQNSGLRGGGEYLTVMNSWDNAKSAMDYFTNFYATNSLQAFQLRNLQDAGTQICQGFVSANVPTSVKNLIKPDSPPQFYARFDTTPYTTATVPATDDYKVFYMIYGGKDTGVYYSVYLKNPPQTSYYNSNPTVQVASGYITPGQSASETKDFTAPTGYQQLCVRINNEEQCGFKQVTTDFSLNYLSDQYANNQLTQTGITTESGCVSGTTNFGSLTTNINPGAALNNLANPQVSQSGIVRICSSVNPGQSTDPTRYVNVGYCDTQNMICWLDKQSVNNAISSGPFGNDIGLKNATLDQLAQIQNGQMAALQNQGVITDTNVAVQQLTTLEAAKEKLKTDMRAKSSTDIIGRAQTLESQSITLSSQLLLNNQKAWAEYIFADLKGIEAEYALQSVAKKGNAASTSTTTSSGGSTNVNTLSLKQDTIDSNKYYILYNDAGSGLYIKNGGIYTESDDTFVGNVNGNQISLGTSEINQEAILQYTSQEAYNAINGATVNVASGFVTSVQGTSPSIGQIIPDSVNLIKFISNVPLENGVYFGNQYQNLNNNDLADVTSSPSGNYYQECYVDLKNAGGIYAIETAANSDWSKSILLNLYPQQASGAYQWNSVDSDVVKDKWKAELKQELVNRCGNNISVLGNNYDAISTKPNYFYLNGIKQPNVYFVKDTITDSHLVYYNLNGQNIVLGNIKDNQIFMDLPNNLDQTRNNNDYINWYNQLNLKTINNNIIQ